MQGSTVSIIVQLILAVAGGGALVAFINNAFTRKKVSAEAQGVAVTTANSVMAGMKEELDRVRIRLEKAEAKADLSEVRADAAEREVTLLRGELKILRRHLAEHQGRVIQLEAEMRVNGINPPPWTLLPADYDLDDNGHPLVIKPEESP